MKQKIKIMKSKPELSDNDIRDYMDFDALLSKKEQAITRQRWSVSRWIVVAMVASIVAVPWILDLEDKENAKEVAVSAEPKVEQSAPPQQAPLPSPVVENKEEKVSSATDAAQQAKTQTLQAPAKTAPAPLPTAVPEQQAENVYVQAEPVYGYASLYDYFDSNLVYPKEALKDSVQGIVTVNFTINADGKVENIKVDQSPDVSFDTEARRLIENMPPWKPATLNGKPVRSKISLPLTFQIEKINRVSH